MRETDRQRDLQNVSGLLFALKLPERATEGVSVRARMHILCVSGNPPQDQLQLYCWLRNLSQESAHRAARVAFDDGRHSALDMFDSHDSASAGTQGSVRICAQWEVVCFMASNKRIILMNIAPSPDNSTRCQTSSFEGPGL